MKRRLKYGMGNFSPELTSILIDDIGGLRTYKKLNKETRYIMIGYALKKFRKEIIQRFGSQSAYQRHWLKQRGLRKIDYLNELAEEKGYKNDLEYRNDLYIKKGFRGLYDFRRFKRRKIKDKGKTSDIEIRKKQLIDEGYINRTSQSHGGTSNEK